jgi:hypothetical protein
MSCHIPIKRSAVRLNTVMVWLAWLPLLARLACMASAEASGETRCSQSVVQSMNWPNEAKANVVSLGWEHLLEPLQGTSLSMSSGCSGTLAAEVGARAAGSAFGFSVRSLWAIEKSMSCQVAIINEAHPPDAVFGDYLDFLQPHVRKELAALPINDVDGKRSLIMGSPILRSVHCVRHGRNMPVTRADLHIAGTPCVHDSNFGSRDRLAGKHAFVLMIFCRQRLCLKEPMWVSENVRGQSLTELRRNLGHLYDIEGNGVLTDPEAEGWKVGRKRRMAIGTLRALNLRILRDIIPDMNAFYHEVARPRPAPISPPQRSPIIHYTIPT